MSLHHSETKTSELPTYLHRGNTFPYNYSSRGFYTWLSDATSFMGDEWDDADLRKEFNLYTEHFDENGNIAALPATSPVLFKKFTTNPDGNHLEYFLSGKGGMWSTWGVQHLEDSVIAKKLDAVIIELGINDAFHKYNTSPGLARLNLEYRMDRISLYDPECEII